jgi:internalin A
MQKALERINQAKRGNWTSLDLSGFGLNELPNELFDLVHLQKLVLGRYRTDVRNRIRVVPKEISNLTNLDTLDLTDNQISQLPTEISQLTKLKKIVLSSNNFTVLPQEITTLISLEELFIGNNRISVLPTQVRRLKNLVSIRLNNNNFSSIPEEINLFPKLQYLYLNGNPIKNISKELLGLNAKENVLPMIKQWFLDKSEGESYIYEAKLILVGEAEAGKTTLSEKLRNPNYPLNPTEPMTKGIDVKKWEFDYSKTENFCANIWDFGGQDIMHATHRYFLTERSLYVLVVDVRAEKTDFYYWLNTIELFSAKSSVIIVMNEKHSYKKEISTAITDRFKDTIAGIYNVNLKSKEGLQELTNVIKDKLKSLPHVGKEKMPNKWLSIRNALQTQTEGYISIDDYKEITQKLGIYELEQSLGIAQILHELGTILHFQNDPILRNTLILSKSWATEAVYLVLLDKKITKDYGKFTFSDLDRIWQKYPTARRNDLVQLMIKFQLCYAVVNNETYIIPQLLPENPPNEAYKSLFTDNEIYFRYTYPKFMPKGILSQIIVKMNRYIHENAQWRTGVILKIDNAFAEITEDFFDRKINIRVCGTDKRNALTVIRKEISEINENFEKLEAVEEIPCGCLMNKSDDKPFFFKRKTLEKYKLGEEKIIKCDLCLKNLQVLQLLDSAIGDENYTNELADGNINQNVDKITDRKELIRVLIEGGEMRDVEFKSTLFVPLGSQEYLKQVMELKNLIEQFKKTSNQKALEAKENKLKELELEKDNDKAVKHSTMKNIGAFSNTDGGYILIGVADNKDILGLDNDFNRNQKQDKFDEFNKDFDVLLTEYVGNHIHSHIKPEFVKINEKSIFLITVQKSEQPILLLKGEKGESVSDLYVRGAGSARKLNTAEVIHFIQSKR